MSATAPRRFLALLIAVGVALTGTVLVAPTRAAGADGSEYVLYYTVTSSYQGAPENLDEIAERFLGDADRAPEVFDLNAGRTQPDGGMLANADVLHAGWQLVLPWDAVGPAVQYGLLPTGTAPASTGPSAAPKPPSTAPHASASPAAQNSAGGGLLPGVPPVPGSPAPASGSAGPGSPAPGTATHCATVSGTTGRPDWAQLGSAAAQAWKRTRGKGELVAVIDSGVDGSLPQLAGHVALGADIVSGSGRGDDDCIGSGTAMAGLIVAQASSGSPVVGVAPDATVMPIRVVADATGQSQPADGATAIEVAVSSGATVIALGSSVDLGNADVAKAVAEATSHDVVVVAGAAPSSAPALAAKPGPAGSLRVGAIGPNNQLVADYQPGSVDVVAPGVDVTSLDIAGGTTGRSGTQYAVAVVAGQAALVRSAYPDLAAADVAHRIETTATPVPGIAAPDSRYGWGSVSLAAAVTGDVAASPRVSGPAMAGAGSGSGSKTLLIGACVLVGLVAVALVILRARRMVTGVPTKPEVRDAQGRDAATRGPGAADAGSSDVEDSRFGGSGSGGSDTARETGGVRSFTGSGRAGFGDPR